MSTLEIYAAVIFSIEFGWLEARRLNGVVISLATVKEPIYLSI